MAFHRSLATRAYLRRLSILMTIYVVAIFGVGYAFRHFAPGHALAVVLAIVPALPIIGVIAAMFRLLVEERDEYVRMLFVRQALFATGFCLTVMTVWEFLQNYAVVDPATHGFGTTFVWFAGLGFGALYNRVTLGDGGCA